MKINFTLDRDTVLSLLDKEIKTLQEGLAQAQADLKKEDEAQLYDARRDFVKQSLRSTIQAHEMGILEVEAKKERIGKAMYSEIFCEEDV